MANEDESPYPDTPLIARDTDKEYSATKEYKLCYDLSLAPRGKLLFVLTIGGRTLPGMVTGRPEKDGDLVAWASMPGRDHEEEKRRGLFSHNYRYIPDPPST